MKLLSIVFISLLAFMDVTNCYAGKKKRAQVEKPERKRRNFESPGGSLHWVMVLVIWV